MTNEIMMAVAAILFSIIGFFAARFISKSDQTADDNGKTRERIGQIEMKVDAAFRALDDQKERIKELREDIRRAG